MTIRARPGDDLAATNRTKGVATLSIALGGGARQDVVFAASGTALIAGAGIDGVVGALLKGVGRDGAADGDGEDNEVDDGVYFGLFGFEVRKLGKKGL